MITLTDGKGKKVFVNWSSVDYITEHEISGVVIHFGSNQIIVQEPLNQIKDKLKAIGVI